MLRVADAAAAALLVVKSNISVSCSHWPSHGRGRTRLLEQEAWRHRGEERRGEERRGERKEGRKEGRSTRTREERRGGRFSAHQTSTQPARQAGRATCTCTGTGTGTGTGTAAAGSPWFTIHECSLQQCTRTSNFCSSLAPLSPLCSASPVCADCGSTRDRLEPELS